MQRFFPALAVLAWLASPMHAQQAAGTPAADPGWEFSIAPYLWATSFDGRVEAGDFSSDIDMSFSDVLDDLDVGALGAFEARNDKLSLVADAIYLKLSADGSKPVGPGIGAFPPASLDVDTELESLLVEGRAYWEVFSTPLFGEGDERRVAVDLGPAVRVMWLHNEIDLALRPGIPLGPFQRSVDDTEDWIDFLAAGRVRAQLTEKLSLVVSGDYGGFDIGSSSHKSWSVAGYLFYRLGEHWDLGGGWRTLEFERGALDLEISGPALGVVYRF